jgi:hypothetical protein
MILRANLDHLPLIGLLGVDPVAFFDRGLSVCHYPAFIFHLFRAPLQFIALSLQVLNRYGRGRGAEDASAISRVNVRAKALGEELG